LGRSLLPGAYRRLLEGYDGPMGQSATAEARRRARSDRIQRALDEALADSFPASDPVAIVTSVAEEDWEDLSDADDATEPSAPASTRPGSPS
jgi:hypothetical protein